ncbi:hypothetical protein GALMADRAFT_226140 [Galerina marginata CBS 339.88]|uniref:Uncharacterized protein n=1 Tax=Galerina marginata (strain CBS 339.88) TaxID=685588 RepID=A0A067SX52_GALM3|nr:hypothetical protein GALMADRAFT_226140 [Galerina marginata CBS 339.88]
MPTCYSSNLAGLPPTPFSLKRSWVKNARITIRATVATRYEKARMKESHGADSEQRLFMLLTLEVERGAQSGIC